MTYCGVIMFNVMKINARTALWINYICHYNIFLLSLYFMMFYSSMMFSVVCCRAYGCAKAYGKCSRFVYFPAFGIFVTIPVIIVPIGLHNSIITMLIIIVF